MYKILFVTAVVLGTIGLGTGDNNVVETLAHSHPAVSEQTATNDSNTDDDDPIVPSNLQVNSDSVA